MGRVRHRGSTKDDPVLAEWRRYDYNGNKIHFIKVGTEWCAIAKELAHVFGYSKADDVTKHLCRDEFISKRVQVSLFWDMDYPHSKFVNKLQLVSEAGIYHLFSATRKEQGRVFRKWLVEKILDVREADKKEGWECLDYVKESKQYAD
jgi:prophage antirepressor-like protein